jgi:hypothetical protein
MLSVSIIAQGRKAAIIRMIDDAGAKGEPIVICNTMFGDTLCATFDHDPVYLVTNGFATVRCVPFVSDGGVISFISTLELSYRSNVKIMNIALPGIFSIKPDVIDTPNGIKKFGLLSVTSDPKNVVYNFDGYTILDLPYLTIQSDKWKSPPPWAGDQYRMNDVGVISNDGKFLFTRAYSDDTHSSTLWSYGIETGEWHMIIDGIGPCGFSTGPDGSIIALELTDSKPPKTQFINTADGTVLHEVFQASHPFIGDRWIACRDSNPPGVILIDMKNNWTERHISLPKYATDDYTIWVPPPGGYAEMMSIRKSEGK